MLPHVAEFHFFNSLVILILCIYHLCFLNSAVTGHLVCFYILAIVNVGVQISVFCKSYIRNGIEESYGSSVFRISVLFFMLVTVIHVLTKVPFFLHTVSNTYCSSLCNMVIKASQIHQI